MNFPISNFQSLKALAALYLEIEEQKIALIIQEANRYSWPEPTIRRKLKKAGFQVKLWQAKIHEINYRKRNTV